MIFEYIDYKNIMLWQPLIGIFICIIGIIVVISMINYKLGFKEQKLKSLSLLIPALLLIGIGLFYCFVNLRYGIYLFCENEEDTTEIIGTIDNIEIFTNVRSPNDMHSFCDLVTINGEVYVFSASGDLEIGDSVIVEYLPQSRIVLEWWIDIE